MATFTKSFFEDNVFYKMNVNVIMRKTDHEYFLITYEIFHGRRLEACGAGHEEIRKRFGTDFDDVIPMHLAHADGVPMHALENGYYYLQNPDEFKAEVVAKHFRISLDSVEVLKALSKEDLAKWVEDQKPRWKAEAEAIRAKYKI